MKETMGMKKMRTLVAVLVAALTVMGIGYAAWSQILPMNVSGTLGNLEVIVDEATTNGVANATATIADDKFSVDLKAADLYPDSSRQSIYTIKLKNTGTLPVMLSSYSVSNIYGPVGALTVGIAEPNAGKDGKEIAVSLAKNNTVASPGQIVVPVKGDVTIKVYLTMLSSVGNEYNKPNADDRDFGFRTQANFEQE